MYRKNLINPPIANYKTPLLARLNIILGRCWSPVCFIENKGRLMLEWLNKNLIGILAYIVIPACLWLAIHFSDKPELANSVYFFTFGFTSFCHLTWKCVNLK